MGSDLLTLSALANELNREISGGRIDKIVQPDVDEVRFYLRANGKNLCLCASCNAGAPRLHLTTSKKPNPVTAPALCMLLRKHLSVSTITGVSVYNSDRIIKISFTARTEMKDDAVYYLFIEIMNRYSNIVFTDANMIILDAVKHLPLDVARDHVVLRGVKYEPVGQAKISYLTDCNSVFDDFNGGDLHKFVIDKISGFSGVTVSEILSRANLPAEHPSPLSDGEKESLVRIVDEQRNINSQPYFSPCVIGEKEVYPYDYSILDGKKEFYPTMSEAFDALYSRTDAEIRNKARLKTLSTAVKHLKARVEKNIKTDMERLEECKDMESYRIKGELVVANIYRIQKGDEILICEDYYSGEKVEIKLDPMLTPSGNSKYYYTKYNKLKRQKEFTEKKLEEDKRLLEYVISIEKEIATLPYDQSSSAIEEELERLCVLKRKSQKGKVRKEKPEPPYCYECEGFTIYKGRNNLQNDELTFKIASSCDVWFHIKNGHGAHVVVFTEGKSLPDSVVKVATEIAASSEQSAVDVDYTERRNVKRQPNGHPGQVIYVNYRTAHAEPNPHEELRIK